MFISVENIEVLILRSMQTILVLSSTILIAVKGHWFLLHLDFKGRECTHVVRSEAVGLVARGCT